MNDIERARRKREESKLVKESDVMALLEHSRYEPVIVWGDPIKVEDSIGDAPLWRLAHLVPPGTFFDANGRPLRKGEP